MSRRIAFCRIADLQSAGRAQFGQTAEYNSAIQQIKNLRYTSAAQPTCGGANGFQVTMRPQKGTKAQNKMYLCAFVNFALFRGYRSVEMAQTVSAFRFSV
jgi:hypothetical protein